MIKLRTDFSCFVDSIDEGLAKLLLEEGDKKMLLPAEFLPKGAKEGTWLKFSLAIDDRKSQEMRQSIADLYDNFRKENFLGT